MNTNREGWTIVPKYILDSEMANGTNPSSPSSDWLNDCHHLVFLAKGDAAASTESLYSISADDNPVSYENLPHVREKKNKTGINLYKPTEQNCRGGRICRGRELEMKLPTVVINRSNSFPGHVYPEELFQSLWQIMAGVGVGREGARRELGGRSRDTSPIPLYPVLLRPFDNRPDYVTMKLFNCNFLRVQFNFCAERFDSLQHGEGKNW